MGRGNYVLDGVQIEHGKGTFKGDTCRPLYREYIVHFSPAAAGECACPAHAHAFAAARGTRRRCGLLPNYFAFTLDTCSLYDVIASCHCKLTLECFNFNTVVDSQ